MLFILLNFVNCEYIELKSSNEANKQLESGKYIFVKFWKTGCPYCEQVEPEFLKTSTFFITFLGANCFDTPEFCQENHIRGYPEIHYFPPFSKQSAATFQGDRSADGFADFVTEQTGIIGRRPPIIVPELTEASFPKYKETSSCLVTAFYISRCKQCKILLPLIHKAGDIFIFDSKVNITILNCDKFKHFCDELRINSFPHVEIFTNMSIEYQKDSYFKGEKDLPFIVNFINKNCGTFRGLDGFLTDDFGIVKEAKPIVDEFMSLPATENQKQNELIEKIKLIKGTEFYVKVMQRYKKSGINGLKKDIETIENLLNQRKGSQTTLDGMKSRLNIFKIFVPDFHKENVNIEENADHQEEL